MDVKVEANHMESGMLRSIKNIFVWCLNEYKLCAWYRKNYIEQVPLVKRPCLLYTPRLVAHRCSG